MADRPRLKRTSIYRAWFKGIKDKTTRGRIRRRLVRIEEEGDFGDCRSVGDGVYELRFDFGPGWRIYFFQGGGGLYSSSPPDLHSSLGLQLRLPFRSPPWDACGAISEA